VVNVGSNSPKQAVEDVKIAEEQAELTPEYQALYDKIMRDLKNLS
jgi:predicted aldo/keto reductase-like oxidoreductase